MTLILSPWVGIVFGLAVMGFALWKGAFDERAVATALLLSWLSTLYLREENWPALQRGALVIDVLLLAFLLGVALKTTKFWPLAACGFQLLGVLTHLAKMIDPDLKQWAYLSAGIIWSNLVVVALAVGAWNAWRAKRQPGRAALSPAGATRR